MANETNDRKEGVHSHQAHNHRESCSIVAKALLNLFHTHTQSRMKIAFWT
jgi:hypothetical protein